MQGRWASVGGEENGAVTRLLRQGEEGWPHQADADGKRRGVDVVPS